MQLLHVGFLVSMSSFFSTQQRVDFFRIPLLYGRLFACLE